MDLENAAVSRQLTVPPAALEGVKEDPTVLRDTARVMLLVQMSQLNTRLSAPDAPLGAKQAFADSLAKLGDVLPKATAPNAGGSKFSVKIMLNSAAQTPSLVIENEPTEAIEAE